MKNFKLINFIALALVGNKNFQFFVVKSQAYMSSIISCNELLTMAKRRKSMDYFVFIHKNHHWYTSDIKFDVDNDNKIINKNINNNSIHGYVSPFTSELLITYMEWNLIPSILLVDLIRYPNLLSN